MLVMYTRVNDSRHIPILLCLMLRPTLVKGSLSMSTNENIQRDKLQHYQPPRPLPLGAP